MKLVLKLLSKAIFQLLYHVEIEGLENFPRRPHIIAPNHRYEFDAPFLVAYLPMDFAAMGKESLLSTPIIKHIMRAYHGIGVKRDGHDLSAIRQAIEILKTYPLVLFAEGTTTEDRGRLPAKPGLALIAHKANVPIVPVTISGTYRIFSTMKLIVHPPVELADFAYDRLNSQAYQAIGERILDIVYEPILGDIL